MPLAPIALAGDKHDPSLEYHRLAMLHRYTDFEQPIVFQALRHARPMLFAAP